MLDIFLSSLSKDRYTGQIEIQYYFATDSNVPVHERKFFEIRINEKDAKMLSEVIRED